MQHLDEGTIHAWLDGALPTTEAREIEQHVADCAECAAMVAEARGLIAGASRIVSSLDVVRGNVIPKKPAVGAGKSLWHSLHLTPARAALAATLMIAVSTLLTVRHDTTEKMVRPLTAPAPVSALRVDSALDAKPAAAPAPAEAPMVASPAPAPAARVANGAPAKQPAVADDKDRAAIANKPRQEEAKKIAVIDELDRRETATVRRDVVQSTGAAGAMAANSLDTSAKKALAKVADADSVRRGQETARPSFAPVFAQQRAFSLPMPACYQFAESPPTGVPQRFALGLLPTDTSQHVVRAINESGRLDSVLAGSSWTRVTATEITVRFASNDRTVTLPVRDPTLGVASATGERRDFAARQVPSITRLSCRP